MKKDRTPESILAIIEDWEGKSYGPNDSELVADRAEALRYYQGEPLGTEQEGRSQVVSRDVLDVIESALPQLLKIFVAGDEVVRFIPRNAKDEPAAEQETAAVNYFVTEKNDAFAIFYTWFKDALLSKVGYVKVWAEEETSLEVETYYGLTDEQLAMLLSGADVEVKEHTQYQDAVVPEITLHDVRIQKSLTRPAIRVANVAPEDILVGYDTRTVSLFDATFVQHRALMSEAQIEEQGWNLPENASPYSGDIRDDESIARDEFDENGGSVDDQYLVRDTYIRLDGDLHRYVVIGNRIVFDEDADIIPFAALTPHIMPHRHVGMSYADLTKDIQLIKTTLIRGQLDAMYLANQPRFAISDRVNLEDMLTSRPGGVVRVEGEPGTAIMPLQVVPPSPMSFTLVEYLDRAKGTRTGISEQQAGIDANALNKTAMQANILQNNAMERISLVARTFANTGVKDLFLLVHKLVRKYHTRPEIIKLRGEWVDIDPREWSERTQLSVTVGLGTGNKDQQLIHLREMIGLQFQAMQAGLPFVTPENLYNTAKQIAINSGFKETELFVTDPKQIPPRPPQEPPQLTIKKMELQADAQKFQAENVVKQQDDERKAQLDIQKFQAQAEIDQRQAEQSAALEIQRSQNDLQLAREKMALDAELKRFEIELKAQTELEMARMNAEMEAQKFQREMVRQESEAARQDRMHQEKLDAMTRPKTIIKDENGRPSGIQ